MRRNEEKRCSPFSPFEGSPNTEKSNRLVRTFNCVLTLPA